MIPAERWSHYPEGRLTPGLRDDVRRGWDLEHGPYQEFDQSIRWTGDRDGVFLAELEVIRVFDTGTTQHITTRNHRRFW